MHAAPGRVKKTVDARSVHGSPPSRQVAARCLIIDCLCKLGVAPGANPRCIFPSAYMFLSNSVPEGEPKKLSASGSSACLVWDVGSLGAMATTGGLCVESDPRAPASAGNRRGGTAALAVGLPCWSTARPGIPPIPWPDQVIGQ